MRWRHHWMSSSLLIAVTCGVCLLNATAQPAPAQQAQPASQPVGQPARQENYERLPFMIQPPESAIETAPSAGGLLLRTTGALLLIVGLIAATAWGLRRLGGAPFGGADNSAVELTLVGTLALGDRRQLSAVRFGERILLLGSTAQTITLLAAHDERPLSYTPPMRSVAELLAEDQPRTTERTGFARALTLANERLEQQADSGAHNTAPPPGNGL